MTVAELVGKLLAPESPWLFVVAVVVLATAAQIGRRLFASVRRLGARIGELERVSESERTRRRQVEAELVSLGVPLSLWPEDPPALREVASMRWRLADRDRERDDLDDDPPATAAAYAAPPVPPFPDDERARLARHRR